MTMSPNVRAFALGEAGSSQYFMEALDHLASRVPFSPDDYEPSEAHYCERVPGCTGEAIGIDGEMTMYCKEHR